MEMNVADVLRSVPPNSVFASSTSTVLYQSHVVESPRSCVSASSTIRRRKSPVQVTTTTTTVAGVGGHARQLQTTTTVSSSSYDSSKALSATTTTTTTSGSVVDSAANQRPASEGSSTDVRRQTCAACGRDIVDRFLLRAIDRYWHTGCLRCSACQASLADLGSTCFTRAGMTLCRNDYIR